MSARERRAARAHPDGGGGAPPPAGTASPITPSGTDNNNSGSRGSSEAAGGAGVLRRQPSNRSTTSASTAASAATSTTSATTATSASSRSTVSVATSAAGDLPAPAAGSSSSRRMSLSRRSSHGFSAAAVPPALVEAGSIRGFLLKQGGRNTFSWRRRFFEAHADGSTLHYYEDETKRKLKGSIPLADAVAKISRMTGRPNLFEIVTQKRIWQLQAASPEEMEKWISWLNFEGTVSQTNNLMLEAELMMSEDIPDSGPSKYALERIELAGTAPPRPASQPIDIETGGQHDSTGADAAMGSSGTVADVVFGLDFGPGELSEDESETDEVTSSPAHWTPGSVTNHPLHRNVLRMSVAPDFASAETRYSRANGSFWMANHDSDDDDDFDRHTAPFGQHHPGGGAATNPFAHFPRPAGAADTAVGPAAAQAAAPPLPEDPSLPPSPQPSGPAPLSPTNPFAAPTTSRDSPAPTDAPLSASTQSSAHTSARPSALSSALSSARPSALSSTQTSSSVVSGPQQPPSRRPMSVMWSDLPDSGEAANRGGTGGRDRRSRLGPPTTRSGGSSSLYDNLESSGSDSGGSDDVDNDGDGTWLRASRGREVAPSGDADVGEDAVASDMEILSSSLPGGLGMLSTSPGSRRSTHLLGKLRSNSRAGRLALASEQAAELDTGGYDAVSARLDNIDTRHYLDCEDD